MVGIDPHLQFMSHYAAITELCPTSHLLPTHCNFLLITLPLRTFISFHCFLGLAIVISQMERQGLLTNKENLLRSIGDSWLGWTYSLAKGSANWLWSTVSRNNVKSEHEEYVVVTSLNVFIIFFHFQFFWLEIVCLPKVYFPFPL